jgi:hypothetical protein
VPVKPPLPDCYRARPSADAYNELEGNRLKCGLIRFRLRRAKLVSFVRRSHHREAGCCYQPVCAARRVSSGSVNRLPSPADYLCSEPLAVSARAAELV